MITKTVLSIDSKHYQKEASFYQNPTVETKACILYLHGGGLLYGSRDDLPDLHLNTLTSAGYCILALDYPLAPEAQIEVILEDIFSSITYYLTEFLLLDSIHLPYFLWGRSAGAYLCLLTASHCPFTKLPSGIISYYGYGFLTDTWFQSPTNHYLQFPKVSKESVTVLPKITGQKSMNQFLSAYVYARQTGHWISQFFSDREKYFYANYTLRLVDQLPAPLFCTHASNDPDVPYAEFSSLMQKYHPTTFIVSGDIHDFDRLEEKKTSIQLLEATISFLDSQI